MALFTDKLFTENVVSRFRSDTRIVKALTYIDDKKNTRQIKLLTFQEFKQWYTPAEEKRSTRIMRKTPLDRFKTTFTRDIKERFLRNDLADRMVIRDLASGVCQGIGPEYGRNTVRQLLLKTSTFDVLIAVDAFYLQIDRARRTATVLTHKLQHVLGFVIAQLGECKDKPLTYSINLICSKPVKGVKIGGIVLLGAFVYCIKNSTSTTINKDEGILELAGGYTNMSGFISYTKMGFRKDLTLSGATCFEDYNNLPMSVDISQFDDDEIIERAAGMSRPVITLDFDDSGLYNAGKMIPEDKTKLMLLNNLKYKLNINPILNTDDLNKKDERELLDEYFKIGLVDDVDHGVFYDIPIIQQTIEADIQALLRGDPPPALSTFPPPALSRNLSIPLPPALARNLSIPLPPALARNLSRPSPRAASAGGKKNKNPYNINENDKKQVKEKNETYKKNRRIECRRSRKRFRFF